MAVWISVASAYSRVTIRTSPPAPACSVSRSARVVWIFSKSSGLHLTTSAREPTTALMVMPALSPPGRPCAADVNLGQRSSDGLRIGVLDLHDVDVLLAGVGGVDLGDQVLDAAS